MEDIIHQHLKKCGGVSESERHYEIFAMSVWCVKGCLPLISLSNSHEIVGVPEVQISENLGLLQTPERQRDERERVAVFDGCVV